ncbi:MAG: formyltransferase family protein [bacterium]|nr:formyltransferase family protein [bacterium]
MSKDYIFISNCISEYGAACLDGLIRAGLPPTSVIGLKRTGSKQGILKIISRFTVGEIVNGVFVTALLNSPFADSGIVKKVFDRYSIRMLTDKYSIAYHEVSSLNSLSSREHLTQRSEELVLVCSLSQILKEKTLILKQFVNIHPGALPDNKGATPIEWSVLYGDGNLSATVHEMTPGVDEGDIYLAASESIKRVSSWKGVRNVAKKLMIRSACEFITLWRQGKVAAKPQERGGVYNTRFNALDKYKVRIKIVYDSLNRRFFEVFSPEN